MTVTAAGIAVILLGIAVWRGGWGIALMAAIGGAMIGGLFIDLGSILTGIGSAATSVVNTVGNAL